MPTSETLDLASLDDAGFRRLYAERIEPCFAGNEADRLKAVAAFKRRLWVGAPILLIAACALGFWQREPGLVVFVLIFGGFALGIYAYAPLGAVAKRVKVQSLTAISEAMRAKYMLGGFDPPALARLKDLRLLPSYNRSSFEDLFQGAHRGAAFDLYEAHLQQHRRTGKNSSTVTVFRGQIIRLAFPKRFHGVTIVRRDMGVFNALNGGEGLKRVGLVDPKFEKVFEVYSNDQVESRYLVHPVFMERLMDLEAALKGKRLRCAFQDGDLMIAIEGGNLFEPGDLFKPLIDEIRARRIVDELASVMRVMEAVLTAQTQY
ncbi:MAG: DUF3137 domain-containing protein [Caulobacterales bacterium]